MTNAVDEETPDADPAPCEAGRGELVVAGLVAAIAIFFLVGTARMDVPGASGFLGPQFFPAVVGTFLLVLSVLLAVQVLRRPRGGAREEPEADAGTTGIDRKPFAIVLATLVLHLLLLNVLGWIIAGALLFWGVSYALGGRHVLRDLGIAFVVSSAAQLGFSAGLGLTLPAGILIGVI